MSAPSPHRSWAGAVLCGGRSSRMGQDKALLPVDGVPMVRRVVDALAEAGAHELAVVGGNTDGISAVLDDSVSVHADATPGEGPLGGLLTALAVVESPVVLVVSCDLLAPSATAMRRTVAELEAGDGESLDLAVPVVDDQRQWLHAAWWRQIEPRLGSQFASGVRAIHQAVRGAGLTVGELHDLDPVSLADADTLADLDGRGLGDAVTQSATLPRHGGVRETDAG